RQAVLNSLGAYVARTWITGAEWVSLGQGVNRDSALKRVQGDPAIDYAQLDNVIQVQATPNDPNYGLQYAPSSANDPADIDLRTAGAVPTGSARVLAADTDRGIDYAHPDLSLNIALNGGEAPASKAVVDTNGDGIIDFWDLNSLNAQGQVVNDPNT